MKKILALVLTLMLVLGAVAALAAAGDLTVDAKVSVTGFQAGDTVTAYQFITWDAANNNWKVAEGVGLTLAQITDGLTKDELATLASNVDKMTAVTGTTNGTTWEYTCGTVATAGSYLILVASSTAEYIYNPAVVSADFDGTNSAAVELTNDAATIKKQPVTLTKEADNAPDDYDVQVGDIVPFTVTVTVPEYNDNWTEPTFQVTDVLSTGLTLEVLPTIEGLTAGTDYTLSGAKGDHTFTISFSETYLKSNASAVLEIKYSALVGEAVKDTAQVHEELNKVTLTFSNDPTNKNSHKTIDDETHHYTFAIDASRFGSTSEKTTELLKVGVDKDGTPVTVKKESDPYPTGISPLAGAEFTLTGVGPGPNGTPNGYSMTATSSEDGRMFFNNLEVGTYILTETKAPAGYIKDQSTHEVVITAEYNDDTTLKSYTITVDGKATSTYSATTENGQIKVIDKGVNNESFMVNNKKGVELPSTGGMGTTILYVGGSILVLAAVILLITKRRMKAED